MKVTGHDFVKRVDHADQGFAADVFLQVTGSVEQASGIGMFHAGKDLLGIQRHGYQYLSNLGFLDAEHGRIQDHV